MIENLAHASAGTRGCLPWPPGGHTSFGPGICYQAFRPPVAPWWSLSRITPANYGWVILAILLAMLALGSILDWAAGQYEITRKGLRLRVIRRWYGRGAQVRLKYDEPWHPARPGVFRVLAWTGEHTPVPWLLAENIDDGGGTEVFWSPVTGFVPHAVRRLRPHLARPGRLRVPDLFGYCPLRQPAGYLEDGA